MSIQRKTILLVTATLLALLLVLYGAARLLLFRAFDQYENEIAQETMTQAAEVLMKRVAEVDAQLRGYAAWDDTVAFLEKRDPSYIASNLPDASFTGMGVHLVLLLDETGEIVLEKSFDLEQKKQSAPPASLREHLGKNAPLLQHSTPESVVKGLLLLREGPLMVSSRPITGSDAKGPLHGVMIMGRFADKEVREDIAASVKRPFALYPFTENTLEDLDYVRTRLLRGAPIAVQRLRQDRLACYSAVEDLYGQPALLLRLELDRPIHEKRVQAERMLILSLLISGAVFGALILYLLQTEVLSRLAALDRNVDDISASGDIRQRLPVSGNDELAGLAASVNEMLEALEASREALRDSEETARALMNATTDAAFLADLEGRVLAINDTGAQRLDRPASEVIGKRFDEVLPHEVAALRQGYLREVIKTGKPARFEDARFDLIFDVSMYPVFGPGGKVERVAVFARDITQRRRALEALKQSEQRFRAIFENVSSGIMLSNIYGRILQVNTPLAAMLGYTPGELAGKTYLDITHPADIDSSQIHFERLTSGEISSYHLEKQYIRRDGSAFHADLFVSALYDEENRVDSVIGLIVDITERKHAEENVLLQYNRLRALVKLGQMTEADTMEVARFVLDEGVKLTKSAFGMAGTVNAPYTQFQPFCWTPNVMKDCALDAPPIHLTKSIDSLWREVVHEKKPVLVNDYDSSDPPRSGCPMGHVAIHRFLAVPIIEDNSVRAVAAVANKDAPYDDMDANQLTLLMQGAWNQLRRRRATAWIQHEISEIADIQRALIPAQLPCIQGMCLAASYGTYDRAGGDFYDLIPLEAPTDSARRWIILIADASGHGPSAAVVVAMFSALLRSYPAGNGSAAALLEHLNRYLTANAIQGNFVTAFVAVIDLEKMTMTSAHAGHNIPLVRDGNGTVERVEVMRGLPLAIAPQAVFAETVQPIKAGHSLLLYTDGVTESKSPEGAFFGENGLKKAFADAPRHPEDAIDFIRERLRLHESGQRPEDDQSMLLIHFG